MHAETCPHYLFLTAEEYERPGFEGAKYVMTPPLRDHHHQRQKDGASDALHARETGGIQ